MKSQYILLIITLLIVACKRPKPKESTPDNTESTQQEPINTIKGKVYYGKIDYKYPIILNLWEEADQMEGIYYYEKIGKDLVLKGGVENKKMLLQEYDQDGKQTGTWELSAVEDQSSMFGTWKSEDGSKEFSVDIIEVDQKAWKNNIKSPWNGSWTDGFETLDIKMLTEEQAFFNLFAFNGRNMGELQGLLAIKDNKASYQDSLYGNLPEDICQVNFHFKTDSVIIDQKPGNDCGAGMGISFDGRLASEEDFKQYWESIPMTERIGKGHIWQYFNDDHYEYLHLKKDNTYVISVESSTPYEIQGNWSLGNESASLILTQAPSGDASEWKIEEVTKLSLTLKMDNLVRDYTAFGYAD